MQAWKHLVAALCLSALAVCMQTSAMSAQAYPTRPIKLMVGFPPGGGGDLYARMVAVPMGMLLGQPVIVENHPGAGGNIAAELVAKAPADGYTLLMAMSGNIALAPVLRGKQLNYKSPDDFTMIGSMVEAPHGLFVANKSPFKSVGDVVQAAKTHSLTFASTGTGGAAHIGMEMFLQRAHIKILHVPYRGSGPAINDLLGGQVDMFFATAPPVYAQVKAKNLRLLAITGEHRSEGMPGVPTLKELGYDVPVTQWYGLAAPKDTPPGIVKTLSDALTAVLKQEKVQQLIKQDGARVMNRQTTAFTKFVEQDVARYREAVSPDLLRSLQQH